MRRRNYLQNKQGRTFLKKGNKHRPPAAGDFFRVIFENSKDYEVRVTSSNPQTEVCVVEVCGLLTEHIVKFHQLLDSRGDAARREQWCNAPTIQPIVTTSVNCSECEVGDTVRVKCEDKLDFEAKVENIVKEGELYTVRLIHNDEVKTVPVDELLPWIQDTKLV
ncbi:uncharacterized protein LOC119686364 isoform X2 [Teleopsis dalmanni]|nr:uncharacterized protein LOC119686364 isoform X2 [Teleopsis dalmanni]XP_037956865.1 uncharacterized protein LOC119686364 isoform X2 [Teleopsis dalmanni]XP_037956866.1 uncharacterized protein LOC119686364 isoform X2 [Teleopsis dalmanni]